MSESVSREFYLSPSYTSSSSLPATPPPLPLTHIHHKPTHTHTHTNTHTHTLKKVLNVHVPENMIELHPEDMIDENFGDDDGENVEKEEEIDMKRLIQTKVGSLIV